MKATTLLSGVAGIAAAAIPGVAGAEFKTVRSLFGAYHEPGSWIQIIPVGSRHAYVHIYELSGIHHDKMTEFEEVTAIDGDALRYEKPAREENDLGCDLTIRRHGRKIEYSATEAAPCSEYLPGVGYQVFSGSIATSGRRAASRHHRYPGEGYGYAETLAAWRNSDHTK